MDDPTDTAPASDADDRWMSYRALGLSRGISRASAARLAHRHRWQRRTDNAGVVQVLVPHGQNTPADRHPADVSKGRDADIPQMSRALAVLEAAVAALTARAEAAEKGRERAEQGRDRAESVAADLRARLDVLQAELAAAQTLAQAADALRAADAARQARGRWARLRAAWRGG